MAIILRYIPSLAAFFAGLGFQVSGFENIWAAIGLWVVAALLLVWASRHFISRLRIVLMPDGEPTTPTTNIPKITDAFDPCKVLIEEDRSNLQNLVLVHDYKVDWSRTMTEWIVTFIFPVFNGSVFSLTPKLPMDGYLHCSSDGNHVKCSRPLEIVQAPGYRSPLRHGQQREIRLEQQLDGHDIGVVWGGHGDRIFDFGAVAFYWDSEGPDSTNGPEVRFPLPPVWRVPHPQESPTEQ